MKCKRNIVAKETLRKIVKRPTFLLMTFSPLLLVFFTFLLPLFLGSEESNGRKGLVGNFSMDILAFRWMMVGILVFLVTFLLMDCGVFVLEELSDEKGSYVMEVLLSSVKAETQFYGKLIGACSACGLQMAFYALCAGIFGIVGKRNFSEVFRQLPWEEVLSGRFLFIFPIFIFGIFSYVILYALISSMATNVQEAGKANLPLLFFIFSVAGVGFFAQHSVWVKVLSFVPLFSPLILPIRIVNETVTLLEIFLSMFFSVFAAYFLLKFSAKVYKANVLLYEKSVFVALKKSIRYAKY